MVVAVLVFLVGLINLAPVVGVVSGGQLRGMYDVPLDDKYLVILMRHRAAMFGVLGGGIAASAFFPAAHGPALLAGSASLLSYVLIAIAEGDLNARLRKVLWADVGGLCLALVGGVLLAL